MQVECGCGHRFEVPDAARTAKCPECGRQVNAGEQVDWLSSLGSGDLELQAQSAQPDTPDAEGAGEPEPDQPLRQEEEEPKFELEEPGTAAPAASHRGALPAEERDEEAPFELVEPEAPQSAVRPGGVELPTGRGPAEHPQLEEEEPIGGVEAIRNIDKLGPMGVADRFRRRPILSELVVIGIAFAMLALVTTGPFAYLRNSAVLSITGVLTTWLGLLSEFAAATVLTGLIGWLVGRYTEREVHPLGLAEGMLVVRVLVLVVFLILAGALALLIGAVGGAEGAPGGLISIGRRVGALYVVLLFFGQAALVMPSLRLGCALAALLNAFVLYAGYQAAARVMV